MKKIEKLRSIDELTGIRFFAALHVVFYHNYFLSGELALATPNWLLSIFGFGDAAVSFFFVLSGFILTYVYTSTELQLKVPFKSFAIARLARLYPLYLIGLILDLPRGLKYFLTTYELKAAIVKIGISMGAYVGMVQSWYPRVTPSWNSPGWSLSDEAFFYLIFPLALPLIIKRVQNLLWMIILYIIPIILYFFLTQSFHFDFSSGASFTFWRSFPLIRVTEFLIGVFIGKIFVVDHQINHFVKNNEKSIGILFWLVLIFSIMSISVETSISRSIFANAILLPCFSIIIFLIASIKIPFSGFLRSKYIVLLGNASFALYIVHMPVLFYVDKIFKILSVEKGSLFFFGYLAISIIFSIFLYRFVEMPCQRWIRNKLS